VASGGGHHPDLLNDDRMGRMLDTLYAAGVTEVFLEVAREARQAFPFPVRALHADATSFHVHGQYEGLGRLLSRGFACEADARRALEEASARLPYHRLVYLGVQEERRRGRVGRPRKGEAPLSVSYRLLARLGS